MANQLQVLLNDGSFLDHFQCGFRPGYGMEMALMALVEENGLQSHKT